MTPRMRFGISVPGAPNAETWLERARRAETGGFDTLLMPEHLAPSVLAPLPAIATAAAATTTLRFGTLLANNDLRQPVMLAREAATLDLLTGGRFELGLGAGYRRADYEGAGLEFSRASERVARLSESIDVVRQVWTGDSTRYSGAHYQLDGHRCAVSPTSASIRIVVGGNGWRILDLAARKADTVGFVGVSQRGTDDELDPTHFTKAGLDEQIGWVREAAGDRFARLELSVLVQHVEITPRARRAAEGIRSWMPRTTVDDVLDSPFVLIGSVARIADSLHELAERFGVTYVTFLGTSWSAAETVIAAL